MKKMKVKNYEVKIRKNGKKTEAQKIQKSWQIFLI
jgi:hypothetical protein